MLTIIQCICSMKQKYTKYTQINTNKSMHSEMGPVWQNPIQRTVRTAHLSVLMTVHNFSTQYNRTVLIISPLTSRQTSQLRCCVSEDVVYRRRRGSKQVNQLTTENKTCDNWTCFLYLKFCFQSLSSDSYWLSSSCSFCTSWSISNLAFSLCHTLHSLSHIQTSKKAL